MHLDARNTPERLPTQNPEFLKYLESAAKKLYRPLNIGLIGLGNVLEAMYLPGLKNVMAEHGQIKQYIRVIPSDKHNPNSEKAIKIIRVIRSQNCASLFGDYKNAQDLERMLERRMLDGVIIATPTETHLTLLEQFARFSIPVFIEKPLSPPRELSKLSGVLMANRATPVYALDWMAET
jgi:DNA-binding LacI/PurR family transcriptional regulator